MKKFACLGLAAALFACGPSSSSGDDDDDDDDNGGIDSGPGDCVGPSCFNNCPAGQMTSISGVVLALCVLSLAADASAQNPTWLQFDVVTVVPDKLEDYRELQFDDVPALQKAGVPWRTVFRN